MSGVLQSFITALPILGAFVASIGLGTMLKTWLDHKRGTRKQADDMATSIVATTSARLATVERHSIICEANLAHMRHKVNNLSSSFDGFLLLVEMAPERAAEFIARIKQKREEDARVEAIERAEILRAAIERTDTDAAEATASATEVTAPKPAAA